METGEERALTQEMQATKETQKSHSLAGMAGICSLLPMHDISIEHMKKGVW